MGGRSLTVYGDDRILNLLCSRRLAIGLEGGDLLIYSQDASKQDAWRLDLTFEKEYVLQSDPIFSF